MDRLDKMWKLQTAFNRNFIVPAKASNDEKIAFAKEMLLHIVSEVDELLSATGGWKKFRFGNTPPIRSGIVEELVDMTKFIINIADTYGVTSKEVFDEFVRKTGVVEERFRWENLLFSLKPTDKVAAVDLDGVLAMYPENWISFVNAKLDAEYKLEEFTFGSASLPSISRRTYYDLKHEFRDNGYESLYPHEFPGAASFTAGLKDRGYKVVILSARPYKTYKRMQSDTIEWMHRKGIHYDACLWDNEKHVRILEQVPNLSFMVEDNLTVAEEVASLGYKVFLRMRPYNEGVVVDPNIIRVRELKEIVEYLDRDKEVE